jgi:hypothetical protein
MELLLPEVSQHLQQQSSVGRAIRKAVKDILGRDVAEDEPLMEVRLYSVSLFAPSVSLKRLRSVFGSSSIDIRSKNIPFLL